MQVRKQYKFEAAHFLPRHEGKCKNLHGHSWKVDVEILGRLNKQTGFVFDFDQLDEWVEPLIDRFDHKLLNCFLRYPSSENLAIHFAHELRANIPFEDSDNVERYVIKVSETEKTWASFDTADPGDLYSLNNASADAEWRSPDIGLKTGADLAMELGNAMAVIQDHLRRYVDALTMVEQLKLYISSMNDNPNLPASITEKLKERV